MKTKILNDKKTIRAWAMFDWANSAYALVIATAIFPVYFTNTAPGTIEILDTTISSSTLFTFSVSFAYIFLAFLTPLLSGIADYCGRRKFFLRLFTFMGSIACMTMFFFKGEEQIWIGVTSFIIASIGFAGGIVFYDSYLPIIVTKDRYDKVSAKGFSYGYIGSVLLLIMILFIIMKPEVFGITDAKLPARIGFLMVGVWWLGFAQYTLTNLPKDDTTKFNYSSLINGYREINQVVKEARQMKNLKLFLISLFLYFAGVQTVVYVATLFADQEIKMSSTETIIIVLLIQLIGIAGAHFFAFVSKKIGNKKALLIQIGIWFLICISAYFTTTKPAFYCVAGAVGMVVGGIQSLSRSSYGKLLKRGEDDLTSFFSLYDVLYKLSIVVGTFLFGFVNQVTNNMRYSVLVLAVLFISGYVVMTFVNFDEDPGINREDLLADAAAG
jgi:UMF1 family MFS transporter